LGLPFQKPLKGFTKKTFGFLDPKALGNTRLCLVFPKGFLGGREALGITQAILLLD